MGNQGDYGCGPRAKLSVAMDHDDLKIPKPQVAATAGSAVNLVRCKTVKIVVQPEFDDADFQFQTNATSGNQLFDAVVTAEMATGEHTNSEKDEDFDVDADGYYAFTLEEIPHTLYDIAVSSLPGSGTINLVQEVLKQTLVRLDTSGVLADDGTDAVPSTTYTHDETPSP